MLNKFIHTLIISLSLAACGGGGGSSGSSSVPLSGSISQGAPIVGAKITLTDAKGTIVDGGTSLSDGSYTVPDISRLTAPILISAQATVGGEPVTYRSLLAQKSTSNIANVTPLTDAVLIQSTGKSGALIEISASTELPSINLSKLSGTTSKFVTGISNILDQITPGTSLTFNPFSTSFVANGESAADKVNDLLKITTTISPTGVETDITDKSNSVGTVTIKEGINATALATLPQDLFKINPKYLAQLVIRMNDIFSSASMVDSVLFEAGFDDNYLDNGLNKLEAINKFRTEYRDKLIGAKFSNPKIVSCDTNLVCNILISIKSSSIDTVLGSYFKYDLNKKEFRSFGNQRKFRAEFTTSLNKRVDSSGVETNYSQYQFYIKNELDPGKYKSANVTLQSGSSTPDATHNFILKPTDCPYTSNAYDGMPFDDGTNGCVTWIIFDSSNQAQIKAINEKIKMGNYTAKFQAWTSQDRSGSPDIAVLPISEPILTTDKIGNDGYPQVSVIQGVGSSLPYLSISNADDFIVTGSLCITSASGCDKKSIQPHTTLTKPGNIKLPSKIEANAADGWQQGEKAKGYFIHVKDKAGRDMMIANFNN